MTSVADEQTSDAPEPATSDEPEPEAEPAEPEEPEEPEAQAVPASAVSRCEAETTVGGTGYRCALDEDHEGEHSFQPVDATDDGEAVSESTLKGEEKIVAEQQRKLSLAAKSYSRRVFEILGDDLSGFLPCELCGPFFPGVRLPIPLAAEQIATLRTLVGLPSLDNMQRDPFATTCKSCAGMGKTLTGSNVSGHTMIECLTCKGKGWVPVGDERRLDHVRGASASLAPAASEHEEPAEDVDPWGRNRGDPDFGRLPQYA